jgi:hypothetical protein
MSADVTYCAAQADDSPPAACPRFGSLTLCLVDLVGGTGIEPVTSSVSGKIGRIAPRRLTWPNMAFTCDFICWTAPGVAHILALLALNLALG